MVRAVLQRADRVILTLFVNPKQFNDAADLATYPRREHEDAAKLAPLGTTCFARRMQERFIWSGLPTAVAVSGVSEGLCGAAPAISTAWGHW